MVLDAQALLSPSMLRVTRWMADYYLCPWGQVLEAVVPAGVRQKAGTRDVTLLVGVAGGGGANRRAETFRQAGGGAAAAGGESATADGAAAGGPGGMHGRADQRAAKKGAAHGERRAAEHRPGGRGARCRASRRTS